MEWHWERQMGEYRGNARRDEHEQYQADSHKVYELQCDPGWHAVNGLHSTHKITQLLHRRPIPLLNFISCFHPNHKIILFFSFPFFIFTLPCYLTTQHQAQMTAGYSPLTGISMPSSRGTQTCIVLLRVEKLHCIHERLHCLLQAMIQNNLVTKLLGTYKLKQISAFLNCCFLSKLLAMCTFLLIPINSSALNNWKALLGKKKYKIKKEKEDSF